MFKHVHRVGLRITNSLRPVNTSSRFSFDGVPILTRRYSPLNLTCRRTFSSSSSVDVNEPEIEKPQEEKTEGVDNSQDLMPQYHLIPISDHPIFPGSSMSVAITSKQYDVSNFVKFMIRAHLIVFFCSSLQQLKDVVQVFASVIKNDEILNEEMSLI